MCSERIGDLTLTTLTVIDEHVDDDEDDFSVHGTEFETEIETIAAE